MENIETNQNQLESIDNYDESLETGIKNSDETKNLEISNKKEKLDKLENSENSEIINKPNNSIPKTIIIKHPGSEENGKLSVPFASEDTPILTQIIHTSTFEKTLENSEDTPNQNFIAPMEYFNDIKADLTQNSEKIENIKSKLSSIENNYDLLQKDITTFQGNLVDTLKTQIEDIHKYIAELKTEFDNELMNTRAGLDKKFTEQLEIERKIEEDRERMLFEHTIKRNNLNQINKLNQTVQKMAWQVTVPLPDVFSNSSCQRSKLDFLHIEQLMNAKGTTGLKIKLTLKRLREQLLIDSTVRLYPVGEILESICNNVEYEESQPISVLTKEKVLGLLDDAARLYSKLNPIAQRPTSKELLLMLDNLLKRVNLGTNSSNLKSKLEYFRKKLQNFELNMDPYILKEIMLMEQELSQMGTNRITFFHQNKISNQILKWKRTLEKYFSGNMQKEIQMNLKKQILNLFYLLNKNPTGIEFQSQLGTFRTAVSLSDLIIKDFIAKECEELELSLNKLGNNRVSQLDRDKFRRLFSNWRKSIENSLPLEQIRILDPLISWVDNVLNDKEKKAENEIFKLIILLNRQIANLRYSHQNDFILNEMESLKKGLEKKLYERVTVDMAKSLKTQFEQWNTIIQTKLRGI